MSELPLREPETTPATEPYWRGAAEGRLMLVRCDACQSVVWYPRGFCPDCGGRALTWFEATGLGTVYSFTITRRGLGPWKDAGAYVMAYVELDEGPRVLTNIVGCAVDDVAIGQRVRAVFDATTSGTALVRFRPEGA